MRKALSLLLAIFLLWQLSVTAWAAGDGENARETKASPFSSRVPLATVKRWCEHGTEYFDKFGVTREKLVKELSAHEHDNYYLGTPEIGMDWQSPNGDISYNGAPGTNCAGFVAYVLRKCGLKSAEVIATMKKGTYTSWGGGRPYAMLSNASNYCTLVQKGNLIAHVFGSRDEMLKSGKCEKGDIILRLWTNNFSDPNDHDNHLMIFWGSRPSENKVWHTASGRNHIGEMIHEAGASFILIKFAPPSPPVAGFRDVFERNWYAGAVRYVKDNGLMSGTERDAFDPAGFTTRGQLVSILWRMAGSPEAAAEGPAFSDVSLEKYYAPAISWAAEAGIVSGYPNGTFRPERRLLRQDMALIFCKYCAAFGMGTEIKAPDGLSPFQDSEEVDSYARQAMEWAVDTGLIAGTAPNLLSPLRSTPRCQTAEIVMRFHKKYLAEPEAV